MQVKTHSCRHYRFRVKIQLFEIHPAFPLFSKNVPLFCVFLIRANYLFVILCVFFKSNQINFIYTPQFSKTIQGCLQCKKSIDVKINFLFGFYSWVYTSAVYAVAKDIPSAKLGQNPVVHSFGEKLPDGTLVRILWCAGVTVVSS